MACASEPAGKLEQSLLRDHLNCPICLETYRSPRALSCMHTYCEECIDSVIVKNADQWLVKMAIECPVCRKESPPPVPTKPPAEWAKCLPMNYAILSLLDTVTTETENRICGPCQFVDENVSAASFCLECKEYICDKCAKRHTKFPATMGHKIKEIGALTEETVPPLDFGKMEYCDTHPAKEIEFFCEDHDVLCCSTCAIGGHRPCQQVVEVKELGGNLKQGDRPGTLLTQMGTLQDELGDSAQSLESNVTELDNQSVAIKEKIEDTRNTLIQQVNKLMDRLSSDCDQLKKENSIKLEDEIFQKKSQLAALTSSCSVLRSTLERGSDAQAFIAYHKIQQQVRQCQARLQQDRDGAATIKLALDLDNVPDGWRLIERNVGKVTVESTKGGDVKSSDLIPLAQCEVQNMPVVDIRKKPGDTKQPWYSGLVSLPNGQLVAIDGHNNTCCILDNAFKVSCELKLPCQPRSVALLGDREVAVVLTGQHDIQVLEVARNTLTLKRTIPCSREPRHVALINNGELAVGWKNGFGIIQQTGEEVSFISRDTAGRQIKFEDHSFMAVDVKRSRVYQTSPEQNSVYAFWFTGEPNFTYKNKRLQQPNGIALDRDRNLCVCSSGTSTIHQLFPDGSLVRVIIIGMECPYSFCFSSAGSCMLAIKNDSCQACAARFVPKVTHKPTTRH